MKTIQPNAKPHARTVTTALLCVCLAATGALALFPTASAEVECSVAGVNAMRCWSSNGACGAGQVQWSTPSSSGSAAGCFAMNY